MSDENVAIGDTTYATDAVWGTLTGFRYDTPAHLKENTGAGRTPHPDKAVVSQVAGTAKNVFPIIDKYDEEWKKIENQKSGTPEYFEALRKFNAKLYKEYLAAPADKKKAYEAAITLYAYSADVDKMQEKEEEKDGEGNVSWPVPTKVEFEKRMGKAVAACKKDYEISTPQTEQSSEEKQKLTLKGADVKVAAWQEAMNEYAKKHNLETISVDGAWGKQTDELFSKLGADAKEALAVLNKDGIKMHTEHFEVVTPSTSNGANTERRER